jgi:predicted peptidase
VAFDEPRGNVDGYTLYLPVSHEARDERYPVLLYLQGSYGVGGAIEAVNPWGLTRLLRDETDLTTERNRLLLDGFIVINLHITGGDYDAHPEVVEAILDDVLTRYGGDPARVSVSGLSRGGHGSWGLAAKLPGRFAAAVPVGGGARRVSDFAALSDVSVWIAHNADDGVVPFEEAEHAVREFEAATGAEFLRIEPRELPIAPYLQHKHVLTSAPFGGHDAWTELYTSPEFYRWLAEQRRPQDGKTSDS